MTFKNRSNLNVPIRLIVALILQLGFAVYFTIGGGALGTGLGIGDTMKEFLFIFIPMLIIIFLIPVIIRGTPYQRIAAIVLSLLPACIALLGWTEIIKRIS
jgi:hypothetical protein